MTDLSVHSFALEIAGLAVELSFAQNQLGQMVAERYRAFASSSHQPQLRCQVTWEHGVGSLIAPDPDMHFSPDSLYFHLPGFEGQIDLGRQTGRLQLCTTNPMEAVEYYLRMIYALLAFENGGLLFHGAGIIRNGRGYVFFGHSGSGKTTVCRLSSQYTVLNDDLLVLRPVERGWRVYGTPFWNPTQVRPAAAAGPLTALLRLVQDRTVFTTPARLSQAAAEIISSAPVISASALHSAGLLNRSLQIAQAVPVHFLHFLPDDSFWKVLPERDISD